VCEQFARLARLDVAALLDAVEPLPGAGADPDGLLGWRTRISYALDPDGQPGLLRHRSHEIEHVAACPLGVPGVGEVPAPPRDGVGLRAVEVVSAGDGTTSLVAHRAAQAAGRTATRGGRGRPPDRLAVIAGPRLVVRTVGAREFHVAATGFWQVHPAAAAAFVGAVLDSVQPRPGEVALDLYAGAGPLTAALADAVGPSGQVVGIESSRQAVADACHNLTDLPWARVHAGRVDAATLAGLGVRPDLVVLDPPRSGAGRAVIAAVLGLQPRAVCYVACDPAALARDVAAAAELGWHLHALRAFDAFPMTHHVECVATLVPG
jgi:tRNA/tmRNA/rRNA uracil-C5-methylase (TrmA/RlmC/RlmD family)